MKRATAFTTMMAAGSVLVLFVASGDASSSDAQVLARQADMKAMAAAAKTIGAMFNASVPYASAEFKVAAETIRARAGIALSHQFATGRSSEGSRASLEIEADRPKFDALATDLAIYANALVVAAEQHPDRITADMRMKAGDVRAGGPLAVKPDAAKDAGSMPAEHAYHMMLQTCTSCHARFRVSSD